MIEKWTHEITNDYSNENIQNVYTQIKVTGEKILGRV